MAASLCACGRLQRAPLAAGGARTGENAVRFDDADEEVEQEFALIRRQAVKQAKLSADRLRPQATMQLLAAGSETQETRPAFEARGDQVE